MKEKIIQIIVQGGVVVDIKNLPEGYVAQIIDKDENKWSMGPGRGPKQAIKNAWLGIWYTGQGMQDRIQAPAG